MGGGWAMMGITNEAIEGVSGGDIHVGSRKER